MSSSVLSLLALWLGKATLAYLATRFMYRVAQIAGYVPTPVAAFVAGMTFVSVLWALSGVNP